MRTLLLLLLFCHVSSAALHFLKYFGTASTGIPNLPEFVITLEVDELLAGYCDSNRRTESKQEWMKEFIRKNPEQLKWYTQWCFQVWPNTFKAFTNSLMHHFNQSGGVHVLQTVGGCEWDDETEELKGFAQFGYDGEDLLELDPNTFTWTALRPEAVPAKPIWEADKALIENYKFSFVMFYPEFLKKYVAYRRSSLRTELPTVSLLQKTPSSPVSCLATGFYPHRASLFWRKDGEELHEEVEHGEILPNHDGTFQMSVDLNLLSVTPEDWTRYDCVFQLSGVKEDIITKLEKDRIRTNEGKTVIILKKNLMPSNMTVLVTAAVVVLALILISVAGFIVYKKMKDISPPSSPDNSIELSEQLNPET